MKKVYLILSVLFLFVLVGVTTLPTTQSETPNKLDYKKVLVDRYDPGTCYGMPEVISKDSMEKYIKTNLKLKQYIQKNYNLSKTSKIYTKIIQFKAIHLTKIDSGYRFTIQNGDCCTITSIEGKIVFSEKEGYSVSYATVEAVGFSIG